MHDQIEELLADKPPPTAISTTDQIRLQARTGDFRNRYYGFHIGNLGLLALPDTHGECLRNSPVCPIPKTNAWFHGMVNLRGNLIPVFDLSDILFPGGDRLARQLILVLDKGENALGITLTESPCAIETLQPIPYLPPLPDLLKDHCQKAYEGRGKVWVEFNHRSFFQSLSTMIAR